MAICIVAAGVGDCTLHPRLLLYSTQCSNSFLFVRSSIYSPNIVVAYMDKAQRLCENLIIKCWLEVDMF